MRYLFPLALLIALVACSGNGATKTTSSPDTAKTETAKTVSKTSAHAKSVVKSESAKTAVIVKTKGAKTESAVIAKTEAPKKSVEPKKTEEPKKEPEVKKPKEEVKKPNPVEVKKEEPKEVVPPLPLEMPREDTPEWDELLASADFASILKLLDAKWVATPKQDRKLGQTTGLVSAYMALYIADPSKREYLERAEDIYQTIKYDKKVDLQWKRQVASLIQMASGESDDARLAADSLHDAYLAALARVDLDIVRGYHRLTTYNKDGFYNERLLKSERRPNEVYTLADEVKLAIIFQYLKGIYTKTGEQWNYSISASAKLYEKDLDEPNHHLGRRIKTFAPKEQTSNFSSKLTPDMKNTVGLSYSLPVDLKTNADYVLAITVKDNNRPGQTETQYLTVKVRLVRAD